MADQNTFQRDIRDHKMTIELDQGVHRCIHFGRHNQRGYHFRLTTWPGHLAISGDCEDFTFSRLEDMFEFFRGHRINLPYWSEKLQSPARNEIYRAFSEKRFTEAVRDAFDGWTFANDADREKALAYLTDDWNGLIGCPPHDLQEAMQAAMNYECPVSGNRFTEFYENRIWDYSHHFTWACRAIQWGIKRYDQAKAGRTQADHDRLILEGGV